MIHIVFVGNCCDKKDVFDNEQAEQITIICVALILLCCVFDMILLERCRDRTREIFGKDKRMLTYRGLAEYESSSLNGTSKRTSTENVRSKGRSKT